MSKYEPEFESLKELLLEIARERSLEALLEKTVQRLASRGHVALARIWLVRPGDVCDECSSLEECTDRSSCLHLAAGAENGRKDADPWNGADDAFRRFPLGSQQIGQIAQTGRPIVTADLDDEHRELVEVEWARRAGIRSFVGQPLIYQDDVLGVLAVFTRIRPPQEELIWLRMIADHVAASIANARAFEEIHQLKSRLELERDYLREEVREARFFGDIVGQSPALANVMEQIKLVAPTDASVLILGESGTGKELVAREIHKLSRRREQPLIKVNCASIPRELYESEFFGHVKGAFTGALKDRAGRFELADRGTLFLDEVSEIPLDLQGKLLRVLQEGEFERVGAETTRRVDVRIIAASNRELREEVDAARFRQDLYYRLNVFPIHVAPLRQRKEDIPLLALHFADQAAVRIKVPQPRVTQANILQLQQYDWPGNVRELQNVIERAVIISRSETLQLELPRGEDIPRNASTSRLADMPLPGEVVSEAAMKHRQRENILAALERSDWRIYGPHGAAQILGIRPTTLASRIKKLRLKKPR